MIRSHLARIVADDSRIRERAADEVTDIARDLDETMGGVVAVVLATARMAETDGASQEAQLNALACLHDSRLVPGSVIAILQQLRPEDCPGSQREYLEELGVAASS